MLTKQTSKILSLLMAVCLVLTLLPAMTANASGATYTPTDWMEVQDVVDGMDDGDTLDLSALDIDDQTALTIDISKSITVTNGFDQLGLTPEAVDIPLYNKYFVLQGNPTATFKNICLYSTDGTKSIISGSADVMINDSVLYGSDAGAINPPAMIEIDGDVTVKGTIGLTLQGTVNHTTQITGYMITAANSVAGSAIKAVNVAVEGGFIAGGSVESGSAQSGNAIEASGNVTVSGELLTLNGISFYCDTTKITGGYGFNDGVSGGHAIVADGNVIVNGGAIQGGDGCGTDSYGGSGIIAGGNISLSGYITSDNYFSCYVIAGQGDYCAGVPIKFMDDDLSPTRLLTGHDAMIKGVNRIQPDGLSAPYTVEMQQNDIAVLDGCYIGWYSNIPFFSGGYYHFTDMFAAWGTYDNAVAYAGIVPTASGIPTDTAVTLNALPASEYSRDSGGAWQDSPTFTGLTPDKDYTFIARIKGTDIRTLSSAAIRTAPDATAPTLTAGAVGRTSNSAATVKFTSDEAGAYYYGIVTNGASAPAIDTSVAGTSCDTTETTISLTTLTEGVKDIYIVVKDAAGNVSTPLKITIPAYSGGSTPPPSGGTGGTTTTPTIPAGDGTVPVNYAQSGDAVMLALPNTKVTEIINKSKDGTALLDLSGVKGAAEAVTPAAALMKFAGAGLDVEIKLPRGTITLDAGALGAAAANGGNVTVSLSAVEPSSLTAEQREQVKPGDLVFDITLLAGGKEVRELRGTITVTVPYSGELPAGVWHLNGAGELEKLPCTYKDGFVTFTTGHLSLYVVGQDDKPKPWVNPFADVSEGAWYYGDVEYVHQNGLMSGTGANTFSPNMPLTRGMIVTILYRHAGSPEVEPMYTAHMTDVAEGAYYQDAMGWGTKNGVISGYGEGFYGPEDSITRQDLAVILARYADLAGITLSATRENPGFADAADIADYAKKAIDRSFRAGIISGKPGNQFDPKGQATRAEAAAMLHRFLEAAALE